MKSKVENNTLELSIDSNTYPEEVLYKCFYWYTDKYEVEVHPHGQSCIVKIAPLEKSLAINFDDIIKKIKKDLIDYKLRDIVSKETSNIRELIIAKAFAYYDIETNPSTDISDPIGFNPNSMHDNSNEE